MSTNYEADENTDKMKQTTLKFDEVDRLYPTVPVMDYYIQPPFDEPPTVRDGQLTRQEISYDRVRFINYFHYASSPSYAFLLRLYHEEAIIFAYDGFYSKCYNGDILDIYTSLRSNLNGFMGSDYIYNNSFSSESFKLLVYIDMFGIFNRNVKGIASITQVLPFMMVSLGSKSIKVQDVSNLKKYRIAYNNLLGKCEELHDEIIDVYKRIISNESTVYDIVPVVSRFLATKHSSKRNYTDL